MGIERMHHLHPGTAMKLSLDVWIIIHLLHDGYYPKIGSCSTNGDYLKALVLCGYQPGEVQMAAMFIKGISWLDEDVRCALAGGSRILHHLLFRFVDEVVAQVPLAHIFSSGLEQLHISDRLVQGQYSCLPGRL